MNALIVLGGEMSPSEISKWIFRAKHTVTSMLGVLENIGYVKREPNGDDKRSVNIIITKKGWKAT
jgi:DNA-binding MarR family transcriptional regulator